MNTSLRTRFAAKPAPHLGTSSSILRLAVAATFLLAVTLTAQADVYFVDQSTGQLYDYTAAGSGTVLDNRLGLPNGVTLDASGDIYVGDNSNGVVFKYTPGGTQTDFSDNPNEKTYGMIFDRSGNFYTCINDSSGPGSIIKVTSSGTRSTFATGFSRPRGLAFDGSGNLYVSDLDSGNVTRITPAGAQSTFAGKFNYPTGLAFDTSGNLYVCSQGTAVYKVSPTGSVSTFTTNVTDPRWVAIDAAGNLLVTDVGDASGDAGQGNVYSFTPAGVRTTYASGLAAPLGIVVTGAANPQATFFGGEVPLSNGVYYLAFPSGNYFGYYSHLSDPRYIYHFDLGYEYVFDAADGKNGVYLYDFASSTFFYTSPTFPFPYLYDFTLNTVLYYYPNPNNPGHYNTDGVRYFYNFANGKIISK